MYMCSSGLWTCVLRFAHNTILLGDTIASTYWSTAWIHYTIALLGAEYNRPDHSLRSLWFKNPRSSTIIYNFLPPAKHALVSRANNLNWSIIL